MKFLMTFSYDGSSFCGYQRQINLKTVQGTIENELSRIANKKIELVSSGRTDAGVHAICQTAHFVMEKNISLDKLKLALNKSFKGEIYIKTLEAVDNDFHARYDVLNKTYEYLINTLEYNPLKRKYEYQLCKNLDLKKMKKALGYIIGVHDFRSFCSKEKEKENCVREITQVSIKKTHGIVKISITGNGFLRKMVRNIVGLLIEIGLSNTDPSYILEVLNSKGKIPNKKVIEANGLYLVQVTYKK